MSSPYIEHCLLTHVILILSRHTAVASDAVNVELVSLLNSHDLSSTQHHIAWDHLAAGLFTCSLDQIVTAVRSEYCRVNTLGTTALSGTINKRR